MVTGQLVQKWRVAAGAHLKPWPKKQLEQYGPWFLTGMFAAILVWEQVWDLPHSGVLSAALLLLITAGAAISSALYEDRMWCRYLCPIGGMNGMFAKMAVTEVRSTAGVCQGGWPVAQAVSCVSCKPCRLQRTPQCSTSS
jgi:polyferredoxin